MALPNKNLFECVKVGDNARLEVVINNPHATVDAEVARFFMGGSMAIGLYRNWDISKILGSINKFFNAVERIAEQDIEFAKEYPVESASNPPITVRVDKPPNLLYMVLGAVYYGLVSGTPKLVDYFNAFYVQLYPYVQLASVPVEVGRYIKNEKSPVLEIRTVFMIEKRGSPPGSVTDSLDIFIVHDLIPQDIRRVIKRLRDVTPFDIHSTDVTSRIASQEFHSGVIKLHSLLKDIKEVFVGLSTVILQFTTNCK